jgi:hypothetical protein
MTYQDHAAFDSGKKVTNRSVIFSHPLVSKAKGDLVLTVNPYEVVWSYGLNTANFPTYGGEVVQILSMYFDDMSISGQVRSYGDIERIYEWFALYMQVAAQGNKGNGSFDSQPVTFKFPDRSWEFRIYPKALPGFKYSRDTVAPTYAITAAVLEPELQTEQDFRDLIINEAQFLAMAGKDFDTFGKATAAIGFTEDNPFSGPTSQAFSKPGSLDSGNKAAGDFFTQLIPSWLSGDFSDTEATSKVPNKISDILKKLSGTQDKHGR